MSMTKIATVTVGAGGASSIDFTSIPGTFTDLCLVMSLRTSDTGTSWTSANLTINGSTANQTARFLYGAGSGSGASSTNTVIDAWVNSGNSTANTFNNASLYIPNYAGATNKSFSVDLVTENNTSTALTIIESGLWSQTAAVTSLKYQPITGTLVQYSSATLYGITKGSLAGVTVS